MAASVMHGAADSVITSALIWDGRHLPGVDSIAVSRGKVAAVGTSTELTSVIGPDTVVTDVGGRRIIPGLIDSHIHMVRGGLRWSELVRWNEVRSIATALERIEHEARTRDPSQWIGVLGGWHPNQFNERRRPSLAELDEAAPNHAVYIQRGYTEGFLNSAALAQMDPGVNIDVDRETGRVVGSVSMGACNARLGLPELDTQIAGTSAMLREFNRLGLTGAIDAGGFGMFPDLYEAITAVVRGGDHGFRTRLLVGPGQPGGELDQIHQWMDLVQPGLGDDYLRYLGAGEVLLFAAHDMEGIDGRDIRDQTMDLAAVMAHLGSNGWPIHIHGILDSSISTILDAWEQADVDVAGRGHRSAIAHAEQISASDIRRVKESGLGLTIQDGFAFRGGDSIGTWGTDKVNVSPPLRDLLDAGVPLGAGTDGTVASSYNPWVSLWWLVTGESLDGAPPRSESQRPTRDEALAMYTSGSAWFSNEEDTRGNLAPGSEADIVVLSADFLEIPDRMIPSIASELTMVGGEVVHRGQGLNASV